MKVIIITTRNSTLKETGFGSIESCRNMLEAIAKKNPDTTLSICNNLNDLSQVIQQRPDLVMLAVKYIPTKDDGDIWLSDYFEANHIAHSGSPRHILKFDSNKVLAKILLRESGIQTADFFTAIPDQYNNETELPITFPLFLKPLDAANGNGIDDLSLVNTFSEFTAKVSSLYQQFHLPVLAEEYLDGREFTVAVIQKPDNILLISAIEIIPLESTNGLRILGKKAKTEDSETLLAIKDDEMKKHIKQLAADAFRQLGARDFGRIDIKSNKDGRCFFMEANLIPGMTKGSSYFPKACEIDNGLSYNDMADEIFNASLLRSSAVIANTESMIA